MYFLSNPDLLRRVKALSPETKTIYRIQGTSESPYYSPFADPKQVAQLDFAKVKDNWIWAGADFNEPINEWHNIPQSYKVAYLLEFLRLADANNLKLLIPADGPGNPTLEEYPAYKPLFDYMIAHPGHGWSRHVYGIDKLLSQSGDYLGYRYRLEHFILDYDVPVYLTEAQAYDGRTPVSCSVWVNDMLTYLTEVSRDFYLKGFNIFTMSGKFQWWSVDDCLSLLVEKIK